MPMAPVRSLTIIVSFVGFLSGLTATAQSQEAAKEAAKETTKSPAARHRTDTDRRTHQGVEYRYRSGRSQFARRQWLRGAGPENLRRHLRRVSRRTWHRGADGSAGWRQRNAGYKKADHDGRKLLAVRDDALRLHPPRHAAD